MKINQGDIFWLNLEGIAHPHVVVQDNVFNHSRIDTTIVCAITTNNKKAEMPGNVLLDVGEGNLEKVSIVDVAKVSTVNKSELGEVIGTLSSKRIEQILNGMRFLQKSFFRD